MSKKAPVSRSVKTSYDIDHVNRRSPHSDYLFNSLQGLYNQCQSEGKVLNFYLIPLEKDGKKPNTGGYSWTKNRKFCELSLDRARNYVEYNIGNIGVVGTINYKIPNCTKDTIGIGILDLDVDEKGNTLLPQREIDKVIRAWDTFTVRTRSGGYHLYFAASVELSRTFENDYGAINPHARYKGIDVGEFRLFNQYVASAGSYVPFDYKDQNRGHTSEATGYYEVIVHKPIRIITEADFPSFLLSKKNNTPVSGNVGDNPFNIDWDAIDKMSAEDVDGLKSTRGESFAEIKRRWKYCGGKRLLAHLSAADIRLKDKESLETVSKDCGLDPDYLKSIYLNGSKIDRSKNDWYVVNSLFEEGFVPYQVAAILQKLRPYSKTLDPKSLNHVFLKTHMKYSGNC